MRLPPSVIEAVLFGNAGRTGEPSEVSLANVWVEGYAATSAGLSLALPIPPFEEYVDQLAAGVTVKYTQGHAVAVGCSAGSLAAETLQADLDSFLIHTRIEDADSADYVNGGSGFGLDLGLMLSLDRLFVGAGCTTAAAPECDAAGESPDRGRWCGCRLAVSRRAPGASEAIAQAER